MRAQFQTTDGPVSPRGNERFVIPSHFFVTPKMWTAVSLLAKRHGVAPTFMIRTILMTYLDLYRGNLPRYSWTDDSASRTKKVRLTLTPSTKEMLETVASFHGLKNAQVVRMALLDYFSRHPALGTPEYSADHVNGTGSDSRDGRRAGQKRGKERRTRRQWGVAPVNVPESV